MTKDLVLIKDLSEQCGIEAAMEILKMKPLPDGAFITNDFSAAVCMQTLKDYGVKIPEDIAIVGFNNDAISKIVEPQLTTIHYPGMDMGEIAARNLINHLRGISNIKHTNTIVVRSELIIRKSSLKNKATFKTWIQYEKNIIASYITHYCHACLFAEDGYRLWLRYDKIDNTIFASTIQKPISMLLILMDHLPPLLSQKKNY